MAEEALLRSWRDTRTREAIVDFVQSVDGPAEDRVATFDNDGTLWCEKPIPIQLDFLLHRMAQQAADDPSLASRQPYKAASERDLAWLGQAMVKHYQGDDTDIGLLMAASGAAFGGTTVEAFSAQVRDWFATAEHPTLGRPYLACAFVPMVELLRYLEANGFRTFIASGGDRDFMRPFAEELYGVPPERVIGSAYGLEVDATGDDLHLLYKTEIDFFVRRGRQAGADLEPHRPAAARGGGQLQRRCPDAALRVGGWSGRAAPRRPPRRRRAGVRRHVRCRGRARAGG